MERDHYFDNVKGALITLVVIGHFLLPMERTRFVGSLINVIYLFHMPMFALISGYFAKSVYQKGHYRTDKVVRLVWLYILFEIGVHVTENLAAGQPVTGCIDFFHEDGAPWYLLAMVWWYLSIPCLTGLKPAAVMGICLCLGIFGGYQDSLGDTLAMSRTLTFAPFFYGGYYWKREEVERFAGSRRRLAFAAAAVWIAMVTVLGTGGFLEPYANIVYGMNYRRLAPEVYGWGGIVRIICYGAALIMILGMMAVIPRGKRWWTFLGQRTLQIYILHRLLRDMMQYCGFYGIFTSVYRRTVVFVAVLAAAVTLALGNAFLTKAFHSIQRVSDRLYERWRV